MHTPSPLPDIREAKLPRLSLTTRLIRILGFPSLLILCSALFASCQVIEGIFKAGVFVGIIVVVFIIGLIVLVANMFKK